MRSSWQPAGAPAACATAPAHVARRGLAVLLAMALLAGLLPLVGCSAGEQGSNAGQEQAPGDANGADANAEVPTERGANAGTISAEEAETRKQEAAKLLVPEGSAAPNFALESANGTQVQLSDYAGKPVLLTFWTTWCPDCEEIMPILDEVFQGSGSNTGDVALLSVVSPQTPGHSNNVDVPLDQVRVHLDEKGYQQPVLLDLDGRVFQDYGITYYPTLYAIDAQGKVEAVQMEPQNSEELFTLIDHVML